MKSHILFTCLFFVLATHMLYAQQELTNWPNGTSPEEVGKKVAERFLQSPHGKYNSNDKPHIPYFEVCTWYGALTFSKETRDKILLKKLEQRFDILESKESQLFPEPYHVDFNVFGAMALELYLQTKNTKYLKIGIPYADKQWDLPTDSTLTETGNQYYNLDIRGKPGCGSMICI